MGIFANFVNFDAMFEVCPSAAVFITPDNFVLLGRQPSTVP
jgi:hypothetical protein